MKLEQARKKEILPTRSATPVHLMAHDRFTSVNLNHNSLRPTSILPMDDNASVRNSTYQVYDDANHGNDWHGTHRTSYSNGHVPSYDDPDFSKQRYQNL